MIEELLERLMSIQENDGQRKYACAMLLIPDKSSEYLKEKFQDSIDPDDVFDPKGSNGKYGIEHHLHVTVLYGLHDDDPQTVKNMVKDTGPVKMNICSVIAFENKEDKYYPGQRYDVLAMEVESKLCYRLNDMLKELPHTNTYKEYIPHMTLAYLKAGTAKKYLQTIDLDDSVEVFATQLEFSDRESNKTIINLTEK